jgi:N-acetylmuramoyl-L-alanine amidase
VAVVLSLALAAIAAGCGDEGGALPLGDAARTTSSTTTRDRSTTGSTTGDPTSSTSSAPASDRAGAPPDTPPAGAPVVVIDPGHNGANGEHPEIINAPVDAGGFEKACNTTGTATDDGYTESAFNLAVAQQLRDRLMASGIQVVLTREDDTGVGPCIDERGQIAARAGAAALVSIHADGAPAAGATGFHVIHPGLREGYTDDTVEPSRQLAVGVRDALVAAGFAPSTYVGDEGLHQRDDLGTLNRAEVPAIMLEAGNLRNQEEADLLRSPDGQQRLADALTTAVLAFVQE